MAFSGLIPIALTLVIISVFVQAMGAPWAQALQYERAGVQAGQWWRLFSAHLVHLGWVHLALNSAAVMLVAFLLGEQFTSRSWLWITVVSALSVSSGLLLKSPQVHWYVGLSGLAHGLFLAGACGLIRQNLIGGATGLVGLAFKLWHEQTSGALAGSEALVGGAVIVDAHLFGALGGMLAALCAMVYPSAKP